MTTVTATPSIARSLYQFLYHWLRKLAARVANKRATAEYLRAAPAQWHAEL